MAISRKYSTLANQLIVWFPPFFLRHCKCQELDLTDAVVVAIEILQLPLPLPLPLKIKVWKKIMSGKNMRFIKVNRGIFGIESSSLKVTWLDK